MKRARARVISMFPGLDETVAAGYSEYKGISLDYEQATRGVVVMKMRGSLGMMMRWKMKRGNIGRRRCLCYP